MPDVAIEPGQLAAEKRQLHALREQSRNVAMRSGVGSAEWQHIQRRIEAGQRQLAKLERPIDFLKTAVTNTVEQANIEYGLADKEIGIGTRAWKYWSPWTPRTLEPTGAENALAAETKYAVTIKHGLDWVRMTSEFLRMKQEAIKQFLSRMPSDYSSLSDAQLKALDPENAWALDDDPLSVWMERNTPDQVRVIESHTQHGVELAAGHAEVIRTRFRNLLADYLTGISAMRVLELSHVAAHNILQEWDSWTDEAKDLLIAGVEDAEGARREATPAGVLDLIRTLMGLYPLGARRFEKLGKEMTAFLRDRFRDRPVAALPESFNMERGVLAFIKAASQATETPDELVAQFFGPTASLFWAILMPEWMILEFLGTVIFIEGMMFWTGRGAEIDLVKIAMTAAPHGPPHPAGILDAAFFGFEGLRGVRAMERSLAALKDHSKYSAALDRIYSLQGEALRGMDTAPFFLRKSLREAAVKEIQEFGAGLLRSFKGSEADRAAFAKALDSAVYSLSFGMQGKIRSEAIKRMKEIMGKWNQNFAKLDPVEWENMKAVLRMYDPIVLEKVETVQRSQAAALKVLPTIDPMFRTEMWDMLTKFGGVK